MYRQYSCLYQYSAYIFNIGTYSDPYTSIGATLIYNYRYIHIHTCKSFSNRHMCLPAAADPSLSLNPEDVSFS